MLLNTPNDALSDFLQALIALLPHPGSITHCCWHTEPRWYHWTFIQNDPLLEITIRIIDSCNGNPDDVGFKPHDEMIFSASWSIDTFGAKVCHAYQKLLDEYGEDEYQKLWHHPFPRTPYVQFRTMIRMRKNSRK